MSSAVSTIHLALATPQDAPRGPSMADGPSRSMGATRGRGAAILAALNKIRAPGDAPSTSQQPQPQPEEEVPKSRGRAAMLEKLRQMKQSRGVGAGASVPEQSTTTEAVQEALAAVQLAEPCYFRGKEGRAAGVATNFIRLKMEEDRGVYEYDLKFNPEVDDKRARFKLLQMAVPRMGGIRLFDGGTKLYLPILLPQITTTFPLTHPYTEKDVDMAVTFKMKKRLGDCLTLFNILFKRIMQALLYSRVGRNYFDQKRTHLIPQHKLEVLPGYAIAVDEYEGGVMVCLDTQHRVMRTQTVLEVLTFLRQQNAQQFKEAAIMQIVGSTIITKYNNRTYEVHEILWNSCPTDTFANSTGKEISYIEYYKNQYDISIRDTRQPLLVHKQTKKMPDKADPVEMYLCLIPELCYVTGLSDQMRADFRVMKDVAMYTRVTPNQRIQALRQFLSNIRQSADATRILAEWGLSVEDGTVDIMAHILDPETILFGGGVKTLAQMGDFTSASTRNPVLTPAELKRWVVFHTARDEQVARDFAQSVVRMARPLGMIANNPNFIKVRSDHTESYTDQIPTVTSQGAQILVFIVPTQRDDRYGTLKKICCTIHVVPTQVILTKTLMNPKRSQTCIQKILLQMNCKMGGALWSLRFPFQKWMICGLDVYHNKNANQSVCGFIASLNESISRWFAATIFQKKELTNQLKITFAKALERWSEVNGCFPTNIVVYRDGVSQGQLQYVVDFEVSQLEECLRDYNLAQVKITMIVVQKRISTRLYATSGNSPENPLPGTVVDQTVTNRNWHDFFLVSQHVRQGTVTPTHYIVVKDTGHLSADQVQKLSYKLCHMYYNWSGTIRVPAPCQYAHKLAYLVGQYVRSTPATELSDLLYFL